MIEALVGMLVLSLALAGTLLAMAKGAKLQYASNLRAEAIDQIRAVTLARGSALCGTSVVLQAGATSVSAAISCQPYSNVSVSFPGVGQPVSFAIPPAQAQIMTAKVNADVLGGTLTVSADQ